MAPKAPRANLGPLQDLMSRVAYLAELFKNLPKTLPDAPAESTYYFGLDPDDVTEESHWVALNRNLEICFQTHLLYGRPLLLKERGVRLETLITLFKTTLKELSESDRELFRESWLERLISAAQACGAKIPPYVLTNILGFHSLISISQIRRKKRASSVDKEPHQPAIKTALKKQRTSPSPTSVAGPSHIRAAAQEQRLSQETAVVDLTAESDSEVEIISCESATATVQVDGSGAPEDLDSQPLFPGYPTPVQDALPKRITTFRQPKPEKSNGDLLTWGYGKKLTAEEAEAQKARQREKDAAAAAELKRLESLRHRRVAQKKVLKRESDKLRQRKCRARKVARDIQVGKRTPQGKILKKVESPVF